VAVLARHRRRGCSTALRQLALLLGAHHRDRPPRASSAPAASHWPSGHCERAVGLHRFRVGTGARVNGRAVVSARSTRARRRCGCLWDGWPAVVHRPRIDRHAIAHWRPSLQRNEKFRFVVNVGQLADLPSEAPVRCQTDRCRFGRWSRQNGQNDEAPVRRMTRLSARRRT
jgi:hypothetical protein